MSHPETLVIHRGYAGHSVEDSTGGLPADRTPIETCFKVSTRITSVKQFTYIPSALSESVSITSSLSSILHRLMICSEFE